MFKLVEMVDPLFYVYTGVYTNLLVIVLIIKKVFILRI